MRISRDTRQDIIEVVKEENRQNPGYDITEEHIIQNWVEDYWAEQVTINDGE